MRFKFFIILLFLFSTATASYAQQRDEWVGAPIRLVIKQLGQADEVIHTRSGTTYYTYTQKYRSPMYAPDSTQPRVIIGPGNQAIGVPIPRQEVGSTTLILCVTTYEVNANGVIVNVRRSGNGCT